MKKNGKTTWNREVRRGGDVILHESVSVDFDKIEQAMKRVKGKIPPPTFGVLIKGCLSDTQSRRRITMQSGETAIPMTYGEYLKEYPKGNRDAAAKRNADGFAIIEDTPTSTASANWVSLCAFGLLNRAIQMLPKSVKHRRPNDAKKQKKEKGDEPHPYPLGIDMAQNPPQPPTKRQMAHCMRTMKKSLLPLCQSIGAHRK